MIVAGELSGDLHGASLIKELKRLQPELTIFGIGGDNMITEGMTAIFHIKKMAFLGFWEVLKHIPFVRKVQKELLDVIKKEEIKTVVLIDYPGFNLSLAKELKKKNIKVVYYISPQIWAWGKNRLAKIKKTVNKMLVVLPFEEDLYKKTDVDVEYVGHPLIEKLEQYNFLDQDDLYKKYKLNRHKDILLLLLGSRQHEVEQISQVVITTAHELAEKENLQIVIACASTIEEQVFSKILENKQVVITRENIYDFMKYAKFGIIKSGTSTLEAALLGLPMVIVYKTNWITYLIGKVLVTLDNIGLVNIVLGGKVVPEIIQHKLTVKKLLTESLKILNNKETYQCIVEKFSVLKTILGTKRASVNAANSILSLINEN
jgi:lipid-A-disaccharide synthase